MVSIVDDVAAAARLARHIVAPGRSVPVVVVTTRFGANAPHFDLESFATALDGVAEVSLISDPDITRALAADLPAEAGVYNGAIRTYPPGNDWHERPWLARRRFSYDDGDAERLAQLAIDDAVGAAHQAGYRAATTPTTQRVSGTIASILEGGERAVVTLDSGGVASIAQHVGLAPAPLDWVLQAGLRVSGKLDAASGRLEVDRAFSREEEVWRRYPTGSVILALVDRVERQRATVVPHPGVTVTVTRSDLSSNPRDRVDTLLTEGDVITVRVVRDEQGRRALRTIDLDDDETAMDALPVIAGGPAWLRPGRALPNAREDDLQVDVLLAAGARQASDATFVDSELDDGGATTENPAPSPSPLPGPGARPAASAPPSTATTEPGAGHAQNVAPRTALKSALETVARLKAEISALKAELRRAHGDSNTARIAQLESVVRELADRRASDEARAAQADAKIRDLQAALRQARRMPQDSHASGEVISSPAERRQRFVSADDWVRHEMYVLWVERLDPATRAAHPWPQNVQMDERFAPSIEVQPSAKYEKALRCAMEAVCGVIESKSAREVHALRSGDGATAPPVVRADGARCKRAYVEHKTPQALRLHYWVLPGGGVELSRVVSHDDVEP